MSLLDRSAQPDGGSAAYLRTSIELQDKVAIGVGCQGSLIGLVHVLANIPRLDRTPKAPEIDGIPRIDDNPEWAPIGASAQVLLIAQSLLGVQIFFSEGSNSSQNLPPGQFRKQQGYASAPSGRRTELRR